MRTTYLLIAFVALSMAALACNFSSQAADFPTATPPALSSLGVVPEFDSEADTPEASEEPPQAADVEIDSQEAARAIAQAEAQAPGEATALTSAASASVVTSLYVPNCVARTDWPLYIVVSGDTLSKVAQRTGTTWPVLAHANCLVNPNLIYVGQGLRVPSLPSRPAPPNPIPVPIVTYPGVPAPRDCSVVVVDTRRLVPIYSGPGSVYTLIGYLHNYAPWQETRVGTYRIQLPTGGSGWVAADNTRLYGACGLDLPEFNLPGEPPAMGCSVVPAPGRGLVLIYPTPQAGQGAIGKLGNYAPVLRAVNGGYELSLTHWNRTGWVKGDDVQLWGACHILHPPTPEPSTVPNLPVLETPGMPLPERCAVVRKPMASVLIYPGPISTGPIALLGNYAYYVDSVDGGYTILLPEGRQGWVSEQGVSLEGACVTTFDEA